MPVNPKYAEVRSVVDHGCKKDMDLISDSLIAKKKGENFGRIKACTLGKFLSDQNNSETVFGLMREDKENCNFDVQSVTSDTHSDATTLASQL